jgi:hypothetical protein
MLGYSRRGLTPDNRSKISGFTDVGVEIHHETFREGHDRRFEKI